MPISSRTMLLVASAVGVLAVGGAASGRPLADGPATKPSEAKARLWPSSRACPNIAGKYYSAGNGATETIQQSGCDVATAFMVGNVSHAALGRFDNTRKIINYTVDRTANGCTVRFTGYSDHISAVGHTSHVTGTDGRCGFAKDWTETLNWVRVP